MFRECIALAAACTLFTPQPVRGGPAAYLSPVPGATLVSRHTTITFRPLEADRGATLPVAFTVRGASSGEHRGEVIVADDGETIIFSPWTSFSPSETVTVVIGRGANAPISFEFSISPQRKRPEIPSLLLPDGETTAFDTDAAADQPSGTIPLRGGNYSLPKDFPNISIATLGNPEPGYLFLANLTPFGGAPVELSPYLIILDNTGVPVFFQKTRLNLFNHDFRVQEDVDLLTFYDGLYGKYYAMDHTYTVVDSFQCGNGYQTDFHELVVLPNRHALLLSYDPQPVDMSTVVAGGDSNATVIGLIVQEIDQSKNVVFQWRSWDHVNITTSYVDLTQSTVDYIHGNAVESALDGNVLLSSRHFEEITKIDRTTGAVIWRMGGKANEFTFINDIDDSTGFHSQHDIRVLPNGNITLFDNGNFHVPPYSRAVEYQLDEINLTATLVWEFRNTPDAFGPFMGNVQRLSGGNTVIGWGGTNPNISEVRADGSKAFELSLDTGVFNYRGYRYEWIGTAARPYLWEDEFDRATQSLTLYFDKFGDNDVNRYVILQGEATQPTTRVDSTGDNTITIAGIPANREQFFRLFAVDNQMQESPVSNQIAFTYMNAAPEQTTLLYPPDQTTLDTTSTLFVWRSVADPDGDPVTYGVHIFNSGSQVVNEGIADTFLVVDPKTLTAGVTFRWTAIAEDQDMTSASPDTFIFATTAPGAVSLKQNFPNPFNPETTIRYELPANAVVSISIYNVLGQHVRTLVGGAQPAGFHEVVWDGRNGSGSRVGSGVYLCKMSADGVVRTRKMIYLK